MSKRFWFFLFACASSFILKAQTKDYEVYAVRFAASSYPFSVGDWAKDGPRTDSVKIDFMVWLLKGRNGRNVLVDAGFLRDMDDARDFQLSKYVRPDSALQRLSIKASDITDIIISHPHWDHIDGIGLFPNAHIWIQKEDFIGFVGNAWQKDSSNGGFSKRDVRMLVDLNLAGRVTLVNGDAQEIIPGIHVFTGSRHTFNSQYVLVNNGQQNVILASDNIWIYYNLEHMRPAADGGTRDPAGYVNAMKRMKTMVSSDHFIIPGHDHRIFSEFPSVADGVVEIK